MHRLPCKGPLERSRIELVVLVQSCLDPANQVLATVGSSPVEVATTEATQAEFRLIQPRSMRGSKVGADSVGVPLEPLSGLSPCVRRTVVQDQLDSLGIPKVMVELLEILDEVRLVVLGQDPAPDLTGHDGQGKLKPDHPIPTVLKLPKPTMARSRSKIGMQWAERLDSGLLVDANDEDSFASQALRALVVPQDAGRLRLELRILAVQPVARPMRLKVHLLQDQADRAVVDALNDSVGDQLERQVANRPADGSKSAIFGGRARQ